MKKILFFLATLLIFASCENWYMDKHLGGSDYHPTDVRTIDYTLTEADYAGAPPLFTMSQEAGFGAPPLVVLRLSCSH